MTPSFRRCGFVVSIPAAETRVSRVQNHTKVEMKKELICNPREKGKTATRHPLYRDAHR